MCDGSGFEVVSIGLRRCIGEHDFRLHTRLNRGGRRPDGEGTVGITMISFSHSDVLVSVANVR